jgi:hypothetical protein
MIDTDNAFGERSGESLDDNWRVVGASICGVRHSQVGASCQDTHAWEVLPSGILVVALADGAGSTKHGAIGARVAVQTAIRVANVAAAMLTPADDDATCERSLTQCFQECRIAVEEEAQTRALTSRDLATTLIILFAKDNLVACGQIGDGACVVGNCNEQPLILNVPQVGEYVNETVFLTSSNAMDELQISTWRGRVCSIAVFCDGLDSLALKLPDGVPHKPFFEPLFRFIAESSDRTTELIAFLQSPQVRERCDDDLTLILAHHL